MSVPIGEWQWNKSTQRLTLSLVPPSLGRLLSGDRALEDLNNVLDGLSRQRLRSGLDTANGDVALELVTAEGSVVHLAGGAVDDPSAGFHGAGAVRLCRRTVVHPLAFSS